MSNYLARHAKAKKGQSHTSVSICHVPRDNGHMTGGLRRIPSAWIIM